MEPDSSNGNGTDPSKLLPKLLEIAREAVADDADDAGAHLALGVGYYQLGKNEEAVTALEKAIRLNPSLPEAHAYLAGAYFKLGKYEELIEPIQKMMQSYPDFVEGQRVLGCVYIELGDFAKAIECLNKADALTPNNAAILNKLGEAYREAGQLNYARKRSGKRSVLILITLLRTTILEIATMILESTWKR